MPSGSAQSIGATANSGATAPVWNTTPTGATTDGGITWVCMAYYSTNLLQIQTTAASAPYTSTFTDSSGAQHTLSLLSQADLTNLQTNGLQALITSLNARVSQANDLLDTAFLTAQTDIYRFRNYILGSTAATALATSTVLANIATGETAAATAENLQNYISGVIPPQGPTTSSSSTTTGTGNQPTTTTTTTSTTTPTNPDPEPSYLQGRRQSCCLHQSSDALGSGLLQARSRPGHAFPQRAQPGSASISGAG